VIVVYSNRADRSDSEQFYWVGKIDPNGDINQTIEWNTDPLHWDGDFNTSIAINGNGIIVGVHQSNNMSNNNLYYRVGHLRDPGNGDYTVAWDSGHFGVRYDSGTHPHISIDNHNQVVVVHQTTTEHFLHYRRGNIHFGAAGVTIDFGESQRYNSSAKQPAVALLDNGDVLEVHLDSDANFLLSREGSLSSSDPAIIEWAENSSVVHAGDELEYPASAGNGTFAVETHVWYDHELLGKSPPSSRFRCQAWRYFGVNNTDRTDSLRTYE
jgi:hypothetical protein